MNSARFEVHSEKLEKLFLALGESKQRTALRQALRKATRILIKETKKNLKADMGKAATHKGKYNRNLLSGIKQSIKKDGSGAKVHIMGEYRLKWFEKGTVERYLRKRHKSAYRGSIKPLYFFKRANQSKLNEMQEAVDDFILQSIFRAARKNR